MRPAQLTPENGHLVKPVNRKVYEASMRSAQLTPENCSLRARSSCFVRCFNEAGAINAGKPFTPPRVWIPYARASMRPAQLTPENLARVNTQSSGRESFNEAGAINAGKRGHRRKAYSCGPCFNEAGAINAGKQPNPALTIPTSSMLQ